MQEGAIMEVVKWFLGLTLVLFAFSATLFFFQVGDTNNFKQHINYVIERQGGLTEVAMEEINTYSEENYGGRYTIESDQMNEKVNYGEIVDYTINATFEVQFLPFPDIERNFEGSSVSQVR